MRYRVRPSGHRRGAYDVVTAAGKPAVAGAGIPAVAMTFGAAEHTAGHLNNPVRRRPIEPAFTG